MMTILPQQKLIVDFNQIKSELIGELWIILGMVADKDLDLVLQILPKNAGYVFSESRNPRSLKASNLLSIAQKNGLNGQAVYAVSFDTLVQAVEEGPVIVSVDYSMTAQNTIPHLIVVTDIKDGLVHYNNPASLSGGETILADNFKMTWKKNYIEIKPERNFAYKMLK